MGFTKERCLSMHTPTPTHTHTHTNTLFYTHANFPLLLWVVHEEKDILAVSTRTQEDHRDPWNPNQNQNKTKATIFGFASNFKTLLSAISYCPKQAEIRIQHKVNPPQKGTAQRTESGTPPSLKDICSKVVASPLLKHCTSLPAIWATQTRRVWCQL